MNSLQDSVKSRVFATTYSSCVTTEDGTRVVADQVDATTLRESAWANETHFVRSVQDLKSATSNSLTVSIGGSWGSGSASASFSHTHTTSREKLSSTTDNAVVLQLRMPRYRYRINPFLSKVSPGFNASVTAVAAAIAAGDSASADWLGDEILREFGDTFVDSVTAGAMLEMQSWVGEQYSKDDQQTMTDTSAAVSVAFYVKVGIKVDSSSSSSLLNTYEAISSSDVIRSYGGDAWRPGMTLDSWINSTANALVAVDRDGDVIENAVTPTTFPHLPAWLAVATHNLLATRRQRFWAVNAYPGCTARGAKNYNPSANVDDGSCAADPVAYTLGGVFQTCSGDAGLCGVSGAVVKNLFTGTTACPAGYSPQPWLRRGQAGAGKSCHSCWLFATCCHHYTTSAETTAYWCARDGAAVPADTLFFGGAFSGSAPNILTGTKSCPHGLHAITVAATGGSAGVSVCVTTDPDVAAGVTANFGGFTGPISGNIYSVLNFTQTTANAPVPRVALNAPSAAAFLALTGTDAYPDKCPSGYNRHEAGVIDGVELDYCLRAGATNAALAQIRVPPSGPMPTPQAVSAAAVVIDTLAGVSVNGAASAADRVRSPAVPVSADATGLPPAPSVPAPIIEPAHHDHPTNSNPDPKPASSGPWVWVVAGTAIAAVAAAAVGIALRIRAVRRARQEEALLHN